MPVISEAGLVALSRDVRQSDRKMVTENDLSSVVGKDDIVLVTSQLD